MADASTAQHHKSLNSDGSPSIETRVLASLARAGMPGRVAASQLDRLRSKGASFIVRGSRQGRDERVGRLATKHAETYRKIWEGAARAVGADMEELADGFFLLRRGGSETVVYRHLVMLDHPVTMTLALNKSVVHDLLTRGGIPVPEHVELEREGRDAALRFVAGGSHSCVVKPTAGTSGGSGVTCGVRSPDDLWRAWLAAGRWGDRMLVERQVAGEEYRLLFMDGELLDAVRRRPPRVHGDGQKSVMQLIEEENRRRLDEDREVAKLIRVDLDCELALRESGLNLRSVVPSGVSVVVKHAVGDNAAADNTTVAELSPELVDEAARAARICRLRFAGIDLVTLDPSTSLGDSGGAILEVNATPGLHYHYQVSDPHAATPVAAPLLERLLTD